MNTYWRHLSHIRDIYIKELKGMLQPILCIDEKTDIDRKWTITLNLFKKLFFQMF